VVKFAAPDEIAKAVRGVTPGSAVLADGVLASLTQSAVPLSPRRLPELTDRVTSVLTALVTAITAKLGVRDRTIAVLEANRRGFVDPHPWHPRRAGTGGVPEVGRQFSAGEGLESRSSGARSADPGQARRS
jgi:hypothetical protein